MDLELSQAYYGVYCSSKEIITNNQRHLYCSMLDLLARTCKATGINATVDIDEQIKFWLCDILPLSLDEEVHIQTNAISALEYGLKAITVKGLDANDNWPGVKKNIISNLVPKIHKLREARNSNWFKVWCLLIRVLDKDILKGSSTINTFLSVVELGFRSADYTVRAEAFLCWRLLIEIFSEHNEISSPKRIKLICIPLKSSQSKTPKVAEIKLRVWWYFICKVKQIDTYFCAIVEPFLTFCFGTISRNGNNAENISLILKDKSLACLASILNENKHDYVDQTLQKFDLELLPDHFMTSSLLEKHWKFIVDIVMDSFKIIDSSSEGEKALLLIIMENLLSYVLQMKSHHIFDHLLREIQSLLQNYTESSVFFMNTFATIKINHNVEEDNLQKLSSIFQSSTKFFIAMKGFVSNEILQKCIQNIFNLHSCTDKPIAWNVLNTAFNIILNSTEDEDVNSFDTKLMIWNRISYIAVECNNQYNFDQCKEKTNVLYSWIIWPIKVLSEFEGEFDIENFDSALCSIWNQLLNSIQTSFNKETLMIKISKVFKKILMRRKCTPHFIDIFEGYAFNTLKLQIDTNTTHQKKLFELLDIMISQYFEKINLLEQSLNTFKSIICNLLEKKLDFIIDEIKNTLKLLVKCASQKTISQTIFEDLKRTIFEKLKMNSNKKYINQIKDILRKDDMYVIIPSVWSLNPEKLTDRQKEKFAEKADIPALYNDMSQSQESNLKPWTPQKIVLVKEADNEIAIESGNKSAPLPLASPPQQSIKILNQNSCCEADINISNEMLNHPLSKNEEVLKKFKVHTCDNSQKRSIINSLNVLNIDAVNGESFRKGGRPRRRSSCSGYYQGNDNVFVIADHCESQINKTNIPTIKNNGYEDDGITAEISSTKESSQCADKTFLNEDEQISKVIVDDSKCKKISATENNGSDLPFVDDYVFSRELSPKKMTNKISLLSSPPGRKITNNSNSPTLKPKPSGHLTGRGAQLINMIRNKKNDSSSATVHLGHSKPLELFGVNKNDKISIDNKYTSELFNSTSSEQTPTPIINKELLIFSKRLPSPSASPSASILKRKLRRDSLDDMSMDSPALKRKRVSFHDPPVSITKEYIIDSDGNTTKPKRCLVLDKNCGVHNTSVKHILKRKNKADSIHEIEKYSNNESQFNDEIPLNQHNLSSNECLSPLKWKSYNRGNSTTDISVKTIPNKSDLTFIDNSSLLSYIAQQFSIEEVLETYSASECSLTIKSANIISKILSDNMKSNSKIKSNVLEIFSENHSKDFLDHAIQENLSSVVCDRLNLNSVIDFICAKSTINTMCRNSLLSQIQEIFKQSKLETDRLAFICDLLNSSNLSSDDIFHLMQVLLNKRSPGQVISESAIDSSSSL